MLRTLIIDDEWKGRESLGTLMTRYCGDVEIVGMADGVTTGISCIRKYRPDLVMLDVRLQDGTGFDLLGHLESFEFQLIFTTAYNEYAIKAFKFSAIDYLLKPIDIEELELAVERARENLSQSQRKGESTIQHLLSFDNLDPHITIPTEQTIEILTIGDIVRIESNGAYSIFILSNGNKVLSSKNLKYYEFLTEEYPFLRIHNSHIIQLKYVDRFLRKEGGFVEMKNGDIVPISRRRKDIFLNIYAPRK